MLHKRQYQAPLFRGYLDPWGTGCLINVTGNTDITLAEVNEASTLIQEQAHENAKVIWGLVFDDSMDDSVRITVIATGFEEQIISESDNVETFPRSKLFVEDENVPPFQRKKIAIDYKEIKARSDNIDIDDDRLDIPTFLRKQAD